MDALPAELLAACFSFLPMKTLGRCCIVSKRFNTVASSPQLWRRMLESSIRKVHSSMAASALFASLLPPRPLISTPTNWKRLLIYSVCQCLFAPSIRRATRSICSSPKLKEQRRN
mmetsp:Transcript_33049/g.72638  ORF Transcript_33049/g.72638 Transcript_33049/m.72638 type:complete len:115 (-) Transcript_33049:638-982(-)